MTRKASDLFSLLSSRGRGRPRARSHGVFGALGGLFRQLLPRRRVDPSPARSASVPGYAAVGLALAALLVGYALGDAFPMRRVEGSIGLDAPGPEGTSHLDGKAAKVEPQRPGPVNPTTARRVPTAADTAVLTQAALWVSAYENDADGSEALAAAEHLRQHGLQRAQPYRIWFEDGGSLWVTVVYHDGDRQDVEQRLREIPAPDPTYEKFKLGPKWPLDATFIRR